MNTFDQTTRTTPITRTITRTALCLITAAVLASLAALPANAADRVALRPSNTRSNALKQALQIVGKSQAALQSVKDYSATFSKKEIVGKKLIEQTMQIKMRQKPFSVYLKFATPHKGREVIYVDGLNKGKLLAHGTGFQKIVGTLKLKPTSNLVMRENRYPITQIGIEKMLNAVVAIWETQANNSQVRYFPNAKLGKTSVRVIQVTHPKKTATTPFHMTRLYIDNQTQLPIRVQQYGFPKKSGGKPPLIEQYTYSNVKTNIGLASRDFDPKNPGYNY